MSIISEDFGNDKLEYFARIVITGRRDIRSLLSSSSSVGNATEEIVIAEKVIQIDDINRY